MIHKEELRQKNQSTRFDLQYYLRETKRYGGSDCPVEQGGAA